MDRKKAKEDFIEISYKSSSEVRKEMDNEKLGTFIKKSDPNYESSMNFFKYDYKTIR